MKHDTLLRSTQVAQLAAGFAVWFLLLRFSVASVAFAVAHYRARDANPSPSNEVLAQPGGDRRLVPVELGPLQALLRDAGAMPGAEAAPRMSAHRPAEPVPLRPYLRVSAGPARSEVFVDGVRVGNSPFVGAVPCMRGESVRIELLPPQGLPLVFERKCKTGTLVVE